MAILNIAITGASSGLGAALAGAYAAPGTQLYLAGRDAARLAAVASAARGKGAVVVESCLDVTDAAAMASWVAGAGALDVVIANAGVSGGPGRGNVEAADQIRRIFATNIEGMLNTVLPALAARVPRVVVVGSIAGMIALPSSPAYSASKAAVNAWVMASAPGAKREGVTLTLVRPGFIRTPMTAANPYVMPGLMDAQAAAARIVAGVAAGRGVITFPWWLAVGAFLADLLPKAVFGKVPGKG
ncbi:MAG: SDR family NAD(P)-dependent oxidoreductase [Acidocella sp.]|nr:SDR family NAD(P)-dependent oxidoreductase [Acidocella sp.]